MSLLFCIAILALLLSLISIHRIIKSSTKRASFLCDFEMTKDRAIDEINTLLQCVARNKYDIRVDVRNDVMSDLEDMVGRYKVSINQYSEVNSKLNLLIDKLGYEYVASKSTVSSEDAYLKHKDSI